MLLASSGVSGSAIKPYVDDVFSIQLRTGNGGSQSITTGFQPDLIWNKARDTTTGHRLVDSERGVSLYLESNSDLQQQGAAGGITAFTPDGYSLGVNFNITGERYVDWVWKKAPKFFTPLSISHTNGTSTNINLSKLGEVGMVIAKITNTTGDWIVWHRDLTTGNNIKLNTTAAQSTTNAWLSVSGTTAILNASAPTGTYIIYGFAHDTTEDGIIQCGSYTGNGSLNGPVVTLGWEPQYLMIKSAESNGSWAIIDDMRGMTVGSGDGYFRADLLNAESSATDLISPTATGFQLALSNPDFNSSGIKYIYITIRRPNKPPTLGTEVFQPVVYTGTNSDNRLVTMGIKTDMVFVRERNDSTPQGFVVGDRLRGNPYLKTGAVSTEIIDADSLMTPTSGYGNAFSAVNGFGVGNDATSKVNIDITANNHIALAFKRAPGFFDVVCYTGTGSNKTELHSLGVQPQLWMVKRREIEGSWTIGSTLLNNTEKIVMPLPNGRVTDATAWNSTFPTDTNISLGTQADVNANTGRFVAYLWATVPGVSSVLSYTGNGTSQTVNCGFSTGARFLMIIRVTADTAQDIFVWDTARGIVAGNDPRLSVNAAAAEVTTDDSIDPHASGFIVNQNTATNINVSGEQYISLAIA